MDDCKPFRPRSGAGPGVTTDGLLGEASQPGVHTPAGALPSDPARTHLRSSVSGPLPQGRHRTSRSRSLALRHGSCLLPLKLRFFSQPDDAVFDASRHSDLIALPRSSPAFRRLPIRSLNPRQPFPFSNPGCETGIFWRLSFRPKPPGGGSPHWLAVTTFGSYRLRSPTGLETPNPGASLGFAAGFHDPHHLFVSRHGPLPLTAWLPGCCHGEEQPSPRKPVTSAWKGTPIE
jgi:hypothetical protein